ncbi:phosphoribosylanthranilate isomerase [Litchfieldia salsa]|nr:phosphoribosylanthranilate isomerase [Litchfieldia salsa]
MVNIKDSLKVKYCGNKSLVDLKITASSQAQYLGFIFAKSKREVRPEDLKSWLEHVDVRSKKLVGVFVNSAIDEILSVVSKVPLSVIQCHGTESPQMLTEIKTVLNREVWKVIHHSDNSFKHMEDYSGIADAYVIDSKVKGMWGGSGEVFDWSFIPQYIKEAKRQGVPCYIAGGVNKDNLKELLTFQIDGIDLSSGIELNNIKDKEIIKKIEEQVKLYDTGSRS